MTQETLLQMELRHVRERMALVDRLKNEAYQAGRNDWAEPSSPPGVMDVVTQEVAASYGVRISDLRGPKRDAAFIEPRRVIWRELIQRGFKSTQIGAYFRRDHSTILQGVKRLNQQSIGKAA